MSGPRHQRNFAMAVPNSTPTRRQPAARPPSINMQQYREQFTAQQALESARNGNPQQSGEYPDNAVSYPGANFLYTTTVTDRRDQNIHPPVTPRFTTSRDIRPDTPLRSIPPSPSAPQKSAHSGLVPLLRHNTAFDAQLSHQWVTCWRPDTGPIGVPPTDAEQIPYVKRIYAAFLDTTLVLDDMESQQHFSPGGLWTQNAMDLELVSWNLVQACMNLHVVGAVSLRVRRLPEQLPQKGSPDATATFIMRIFYLELALRHFKLFAHKIMSGGHDFEEHVMYIHHFLFKRQHFGQVMQQGFTKEQRAMVLREMDERRTASDEAMLISISPPRFEADIEIQGPVPHGGGTGQQAGAGPVRMYPRAQRRSQTGANVR